MPLAMDIKIALPRGIEVMKRGKYGLSELLH